MELIINGIRYIGTLKEGTTNVYNFIDPIDGSNCLRYYTPYSTENISFSKDKITESNGLMGDMNYYIKEYEDSNDTWTIALSTSHIRANDDSDIVGWITKEEFESRYKDSMFKAIVKFHPNGGAPIENSSYSINPLDNCSTYVEFFDNIYTDVYDLFTHEDYDYDYNSSGNTYWRIYNSIDSSIFLDGEANVLIENIVNSKIIDYIPVYPNKYYYLYAQWKKTGAYSKDHTIYYLNQDETPIMSNNSSLTSTYHNDLGLGSIYLSYSSLTGSIPSSNSSNQYFIGWDENKNAINPKYGSLSDFRYQPLQDVNLYAIFANSLNSYPTQEGLNDIRYYPNGGWFGPRRQKVPNAVDKVPRLGYDLSGTEWPLPFRMDNKFFRWSHSNGQFSYPGDGQYGTNNDYRTNIAEWGATSDITNTPTSENYSTEQTFSFSFDTDSTQIKIAAGVIEPVNYHRILKIQCINVNHSGSSIGYGIAHVFDDCGNEITGQLGQKLLRYNYNSNSTTPPYEEYLLLANVRYQVEMIGEKVIIDDAILNKNDVYLEYAWNIQQKITTLINTETIFANGGYFKLKDNDNYIEETSISFTSNRDWVGISSNNNEGLTYFNNETQNFPSLATNKTGYWQQGWIGSDEAIPNCLKTINSVTAWATPLPHKDFSVDALWNPNIYYIKYNGNNNNVDTHMADQLIVYQEGVYIEPGDIYYEKTTNIIFNPRKGNYIESDWNFSNPITIITGSGSGNRKIEIEHEWLNWNYKDIKLDREGQYDFNELLTSLNIENTSNLLSTYGQTIELISNWQINSIVLPNMEREGFIFMGWYDAPEGGNKIGDGGDEFTYEDHEITLYAHWDPIGLVMINTPKGWKKAAPYIYTDGTWKRALTNIYTNSEWQLGTNLGQNATDEQLEFL